MPVLITEVRMLALVSPVLGVVTSPYNPARIHPISKQKLPHLGTDFVAPLGTDVRALADGVVVATAKRAPGDASVNGVLPGRSGSCVLVDHGDGLRSYYGHTAPHVGPGTRVVRGQVVGRSDGSGNVTGPHLHFEVHVNGVAIDPEPWAEQRGLDIGITETNQEDDVSLPPEQVQQLSQIPGIAAKVQTLVYALDNIELPALKRIDVRTAKLLVDSADDGEVAQIIAGVLAGLPAPTIAAAVPADLARAVADELQKRLAS